MQIKQKVPKMKTKLKLNMENIYTLRKIKQAHGVQGKFYMANIKIRVWNNCKNNKF